MRNGKVSEAVLKRSVLRPLARAEVLGQGAAFGEDCGYMEQASTAKASGTEVFAVGESMEKTFREEASMAVVSVIGTVGGDYDRTLEMLVRSVADNLICSGARLEAMTVQILLSPEVEETGLQELIRELGSVCKKLNVRIAAGHTEVSKAVSWIVCSLTGWGSAGKRLPTAGLGPEQDLVMAGWTGMAGTVILAKNRETELLKRYPGALVDQAVSMADRWIVPEAARAGNHFGVTAMHDVSQGGAFGALWELAECAGVGLEVDLKKIPIRQETIEICDHFGINPYQLYGQGALLLGTPRGGALKDHLLAAGIPAAVIGHTTPGKDRIIRNGEDIRYLDRPAQDELWSL